MTYEIYAVEQNLMSLITAVRFRVHEQVGSITRMKDDCRVEFEGRYDYADPDLQAMVETAYKEAMGL